MSVSISSTVTGRSPPVALTRGPGFANSRRWHPNTQCVRSVLPPACEPARRASWTHLESTAGGAGVLISCGTRPSVTFWIAQLLHASIDLRQLLIDEFDQSP